MSESNFSSESFNYALKVINGDTAVSLLPYHYQNETDRLLKNYSDLDSPFVAILKKKINEKLGKKFAEKRDAIRWIGDYGYDCENEDMVIFLAAYIKLGNDYQNWVNNGSEGIEPYTPYKVYINKNSKEKALKIHTFPQLEAVYNAVRNSQLDAYVWLNQKKEEASNINNFQELFQFYKNIDNL